jgi:hypothetical protein
MEKGNNMGWIIFGAIVMLLALGYVAHKFPTIFGKAVATGATVVNAVDNTVKSEIYKVTAKSSNTAGK